MKILLELKNIKIPSINEKFGRSKWGTLYLNKIYSDFKRLIEFSCINQKFDPPYKVVIGVYNYIDIDNGIKCFLDGISKTISNDRDILQLQIFKIRNKKNRPSNLIIFIEEIEEYYKLPDYFPKEWNDLMEI